MSCVDTTSIKVTFSQSNFSSINTRWQHLSDKSWAMRNDPFMENSDFSSYVRVSESNYCPIGETQNMKLQNRTFDLPITCFDFKIKAADSLNNKSYFPESSQTLFYTLPNKTTLSKIQFRKLNTLLNKLW